MSVAWQRDSSGSVSKKPRPDTDGKSVVCGDAYRFKHELFGLWFIWNVYEPWGK